MNPGIFYTRKVSPEGLISINDILYQVPTGLGGQTIIVDLDRLEYRPTSFVSHNEGPCPAIIELQPGLLTAREINDRRAAHEVGAETQELLPRPGDGYPIPG